jgi:Alpha amylase, catalytic domain
MIMKILVLLLCATGLARAVGTLTVSTPGYTGNRSAEYTISHVYIDEVVATTAPVTFRFTPGVAGVIDVELWTNINRRDLADIDKNADGYSDGVVPVNGNTVSDSATDTDLLTGHYFAPLNMTNAGGGTWEIVVPVAKTGAYRVSARFRTSDSPGTWQWYGLRDHCVVAAPVVARDVRLYEINVFNIEADGDTFFNRSTLEDLHNGAGAPHAANNRWDLDYLKGLGCNWLWFQPIHPNGIDGRENVPNTSTPYDPGSPYAVKNFFEVNPLMTSQYDGASSESVNRAAAMAAWQNFVTAADTKGVGIMLDSPFNHTAFDVELGVKGVDLFQRDGESAWSPEDQIRNREARFFSRSGNYGQRAFDTGSIAAGPDRFDFGKWNDVKDVFFGRYDALVEYDSEPERSSYTAEGDWFDSSQFEWTNSDFTQGGQEWNVTRRVWQYFAQYAVHWLEKTRPVGQNRNSLPADGNSAARYEWDARGIDGLRCDFGQGLPPQCWEYIINVARSKKWSFVMMTESLDGGNVTYRSARQFDVLNENIVFPLKSAANKQSYRDIYESRRAAYGQALVLANTTSHDEEVMADPWQSLVRFLVCNTLDGVPLVFPGQELGISTTFGYNHYETNFGKQIPHFKRWNSMTPIWSNTDFGNDQLYPVFAAANRARANSRALSSSNRWFLDGDGNNAQIHAVAKYETPNVSPGVSDVVLAFSNLDRNSLQSDNFRIPPGLAPLLGIKDGRVYNTRNLAAYTAQDANRDDLWLWGNGITGANLKSGGFFVSLNKVPVAAGDWTAAPFEGQYLKLYDVTLPPVLGAPVPVGADFGTVMGNQVTFTWSAASDPDGGVSGFRFQLGSSPGAADLSDTRTSNVSQSVTVAFGTVVYARILQMNNAGIQGQFSNPSVAVIALDPVADHDGDGQSNGAEQTAGTNPLSSGSVLRATATTIAGNTVAITIATVPGKSYQLETSTTLAPQSWSNVGIPVIANGSSTVLADPSGAADPKRFYRAKVIP